MAEQTARIRALLLLAAASLLAVLAAGSWIRVEDEGGAWLEGRYLGPGFHLRRPFAAFVRYPAAPPPLVIERPIASEEGIRHRFTFRVDYRWHHRRLARDPLAPSDLRPRLEGLLSELERRYPAGRLGAGVREVLPGLLARLPIRTVRVEATYPGQAFESLLATDRPSGQRVVLVAMDGLDWVLLDRLIAEGRCPNLARFKRTGAWGEIVSHQPVLSPLIWTSIATGRLPEIHGVLDFVARDPMTGEDTPITNRSRRVQALWNILSYVDRRVDVVNWWASYPAERINGTMVSERVFYQLFGIRPQLDDPANVHPPAALAALKPLLLEADEISFEEVRRLAAVSRAEFDAALEEAKLADNPFDNRLNHLRKILAVTRGVFNVGRRLLAEDPADFLALYVEGTDTVGHRFAQFLPPRLDWVDPDDYRRYRDTMARFYELCDRELGELMRGAPAGTTWIVAADHGFHTGRARPGVPPDDFTVGAPQWHRMVGVFLATGPEVKAGKIPHLDIYDLARTLLWLLGAPISRQLEGREVTELMSAPWVAEHPPVYVESYDDLPRSWIAQTPDTADSATREARLRELRALGYLSAAGSTSGPAGSGTTAVPQTSPDLVAKPSELYNKGKLARQRGALAEAEGYFLEALEADPGFALAMTSLAGVMTAQDRHEDALRWLLRAVDTGSELLPATILLDLVLAAEAAGRLDRIVGALRLVRDRWGDSSSFDTAHGLAFQRLGRADDAAAAYRRALAKDPADAVATEEMLVLAAQGRKVPIEEMLGRHLEAVRYDLKRLNDFAVVCLRQGRPAWAERALRAVLESDPTNAGVLGNLAVALQMQGRLTESAEALERAVAGRPDDGGLCFNYGAVLADLGRDREALEQLDRAQHLGLTGARLFAARGKVLFRLGRAAEARSALEEGARRHPDDAEIRQLLDLLAEEG